MRLLKTFIFINALTLSSSLFAAKAVDLSHAPIALRNSMMGLSATKPGSIEWQQIRKETDKQKITHLRFQQTYRGVPVLGGAGIQHIAAGKNGQTMNMNGKVFQDLEKDLSALPQLSDSKEGGAKALASAKAIYQQQNPAVRGGYQQEHVKKVIYIDNNQVAHYGYLVSFYLDNHTTGAHRPVMILDAMTFQLFKSWDEVRTIDDDEWVKPTGGVGGNPKIGRQIYDGAPGHMPSLFSKVYESADEHGNSDTVCDLATKDIIVKDVAYDSMEVNGLCELNPGHNNVYWMSLDEGGTSWKDDAINSGYSPSLDAFYNAMIVKKMYQEWYGIPVLVEKDGVTPMQLVMRVHYGRRLDNAFWDGATMTFGDGGDDCYPLTSLDVTSHEIAHGFTDLHSHISGMYPQMSALHESFSDMAAAATEYYTTGKNTWELGATIMKKEGGAFRWMDNPTKDGESIDNMANYHDPIDPHLAGGITNKAFYLLATTPGWNTHKAFDVMVRANRYYWNESTSTLTEAACGVVAATKDVGYSVPDVQTAFKQVGLDTSGC